MKCNSLIPLARYSKNILILFEPNCVRWSYENIGINANFKFKWLMLTEMLKHAGTLPMLLHSASKTCNFLPFHFRSRDQLHYAT